jgi:hypothetical protein
MQVVQYAPTNEDVLALARAETTAQAKPLVQALRLRIGELQDKLEMAPRRSDELTEDCGGILCEMRGLKWLLNLIEEARDLCNRA